MGHALQESWRVLHRHGSLVDLRPLAGKVPLEIVVGQQTDLVGWIYDLDFEDDETANQAIRDTLEKGLFGLEHQSLFDYAIYWDTLETCIQDIQTNWSNLLVSAETIDAATQAIEPFNPTAKLRIRRPMMMACYAKQLP